MLQDGMMAFALLGAEWVMWLLVILSLVCAAVTLERIVVLIIAGLARIMYNVLVQQMHRLRKTAQCFLQKVRSYGGV